MSDSPSSSREFFERHYWTFLKVREAYAAAHQPVIRFWKETEGLADYERLIFGSISGRRTVLDVGAGDLRIRKKMLDAGFTGSYLTLDHSTEYQYDYSSLNDVPRQSVDAIVCLEVIEHIPLEESFQFFETLTQKLTPGGRIILSTPNADAIWSLWSSDFTHVHSYRSVDLAAYLHVLGFESQLYRIAWQSPHERLSEKLRFQIARVITRKLLQVDYARGIMVVASRTASPRLPPPARL